MTIFNFKGQYQTKDGFQIETPTHIHSMITEMSAQVHGYPLNYFFPHFMLFQTKFRFKKLTGLHYVTSQKIQDSHLLAIGCV